MIIHGKPHCDICKQELKHAEDEETHYAEGEHQGLFWKGADVMYCEDCSDKLMDKVGYPPCGECETQPCEKGRDCWASPPLHLFPYELYVAEKLTRLTGSELTLDKFAQKGDYVQNLV